MPAPVIAAGLPVAGQLLGGLLGGDQQTQAVVPDDMQGMRGQQMGLLNFLLGMGPDPRTAQQGTQSPRPQNALSQSIGPGAYYEQLRRQQGSQIPTTYAGSGPGGSWDTPGAPQPMPGMQPLINQQGVGGGQVPGQGGGVMTPQQRLESFFGPMGINPSTLQQGASNSYQQMLSMPSPEQRASEITLPQLQQGLSGNPQTQAATNGLMGLQTGAGADVEGRLSQIGDRPITGFGDLDQILQQLGGGQNGAINFNPGGAGMDILSRLAQSNPGQGVVQALDPTYQRGLAAANQEGGRFGSGNAILRSRALDDYNLAAQNAMQRGVDQQTTAAQALGQLGLGGDQLRLQGLLGGQGNQLEALRMAISGSQGLDQSALQALNSLGGLRLQGQGQQAQNLQAAGNLGLGQGQLQNQTAQTLAQILGQQGAADLNRTNSAFGAGTVETQQQNQGAQQALQILLQQLGVAQGATLGGPVSQTPSGAQQGAQLGGDIGQLLLLQQYLSGQNAQSPKSQGVSA